MKTSAFFSFILGVLTLSSCKKENTAIVKSENVTEENVRAAKISWSQLPAEYRDAVAVSTAVSMGSAIANLSGSATIETFGPYGNISGSSFGIFPPAGSTITAVGVGDDGGSTVKNITIWYKNAAGKLTKAQAGKTSNEDLIDFRALSTGEYILSVSGRKSTYLTQLTIKTNKNNSISAGGTGGTAFSATTTPGYWLFGVWGYASTDRIYQVNFNVHCKPWQQLAGSAGRDIAVAVDGTSYMINTSGKIYKMSPGGITWTQLAGSGGLNIAANGSRVCMVNTAGKVYELLGSTWKQLSGSDAVDITITSDNKLWMTNTDGEIYRYNDDTKAWEQMPGLLDGFYAAYRIAAGKEIWALGKYGDIVYDAFHAFTWNGTDWNYVSYDDIDGNDIAVGNDGNIWLTNTDGILYHYNKSTPKWDELCGSSGFTVASNNNKVMMVNTSGLIYKLTY